MTYIYVLYLNFTLTKYCTTTEQIYQDIFAWMAPLTLLTVSNQLFQITEMNLSIQNLALGTCTKDLLKQMNYLHQVCTQCCCYCFLRNVRIM